MKQVFPQTRGNNIVVQELLDEVLIYDLIRDKAFCLNGTSALIWQECDGTKSIPEIRQNISRKLNSTIDENLVWLALEQLKQENLLENAEDSAFPLNDLTRREAIKKAGLASMVALPLITAIVAPTAASAQSRTNCLEENAACDPNVANQCCENLFCQSPTSDVFICQPPPPR